MRSSTICTVLGAALVGAAVVAGCSSSDSTGDGSTGGSGGNSNGGSSAGGNSSAGTGGTIARGGQSGSGSAGADSSSAGADSSSAGADSSAAGADSSAAGAGGSADQGPQACNSLAFSGTVLGLMHSSAAVPTLQNGTLQAGDYRLTGGGVYDSGSGIFSIGEVAHVTVAGSTATIQLADNWGVTSTIVLTMGQPSSMPPSSVKLTCDTDPALRSYLNTEASGAIKYGVDGNTVSLYEVPLKLLLVFTLQP